jgi:hypothetical protein
MLRFEARARGAALAVGVLVGLLSATGCKQKADLTRDLLRERQQGWAGQLAILARTEADLAAQLRSVPVGALDVAGNAETRRRQVAAQVDGARQALVDIEGQRREVDSRVEAAITRDAEEGVKALDTEGERIDGYVRALRDLMGSTQHDLIALTRGDSSAAAVVGANEPGASTRNN